MIRSRKILVLPGDGIGPEVVEQVQKIIAWMNHELSAGFDVEVEHIGGSSIDRYVRHLPSTARATMELVNFRRQCNVGPSTGRHRPLDPSVDAALGNLEQSAHFLDRMGGLVCLHESEKRFGVAGFSFANQAAAFERISRSSRSFGSHAVARSAPHARGPWHGKSRCATR